MNIIGDLIMMLNWTLSQGFRFSCNISISLGNEENQCISRIGRDKPTAQTY